MQPADPDRVRQPTTPLLNLHVFLIALVPLTLRCAIEPFWADEGMRWKVGQHFAWGSSEHPPGVQWILGITRLLLPPLQSIAEPELQRIALRLCFIILSAITIGLVHGWLRREGASRIQATFGDLALMLMPPYSGSVLALPDSLLLFGTVFSFVATWELVHSRSTYQTIYLLFGGILLANLGKFYGIFVSLSAFATLWVYAQRITDYRPALRALGSATLCALAPIIIWESQTGGANLIFELATRHRLDIFSWLNVNKFWLFQAAYAGIPLIIAFKELLADSINAVRENGAAAHNGVFFLLWIVPPAAIFLIYPFFFSSWSYYHWPLVMWLHLSLFFSLAYCRGRLRWLFSAHVLWSTVVCGLLTLLWLKPTAMPLPYDLAGITRTQGRLGWEEVPAHIKKILADEQLDIHTPILTSNWACASLLALHLGDEFQVSVEPARDTSAADWPPATNLLVGEGSAIFVAQVPLCVTPRHVRDACQKWLPFYRYFQGSVLLNVIEFYRCDRKRLLERIQNE